MQIIHFIIGIPHYILSLPASTWYHAAAFFLTGLGTQYTVQLIKVLNKNRYGKMTLRFFNGAFSTLYVAAGAMIAGGMAFGNMAEASAAVATLSAVIYRIHDSVLYKSGSAMVDTETRVNYTKPSDASPEPDFDTPSKATPASAFSGDPE